MLDFNKTLYELLNNDRDLLNFFLLNGFEQLKNPTMLNTIGKSLTLENACKAKNIDKVEFVNKYNSWLKKLENNEDSSLARKHKATNAQIKVVGILPCPIRVPLLENFENFIKTNNLIDTIDYDLRSANLGLDWMEDVIRNATDEAELPDILMSAGFKLFFDKKLIGKFMDQGIYQTPKTQISNRYTDFECNLLDPKENYHIIGVVPAIFIVNHKVLNGRKVPTSWEDIMQPEFKGSVAVPMGDLDLFNAILINIYEHFGMKGITKLGKSFARDLHPAQMVKTTTPAVSIAPYFFATMIKPDNDAMSYVWPKEGAAASPIFMISKKSKMTELQPIFDYVLSTETSEIYSAEGKFPCTNPNVRNILPNDMKLLFPSWDLLNNTDVSSLLDECEKEFFASSNRG